MAPAEAGDTADPISAEVMVGGDLVRDPAATIADLKALVKIIEHQMGDRGAWNDLDRTARAEHGSR